MLSPTWEGPDQALGSRKDSGAVSGHHLKGQASHRHNFTFPKSKNNHLDFVFNKTLNQKKKKIYSFGGRKEGVCLRHTASCHYVAKLCSSKPAINILPRRLKQWIKLKKSHLLIISTPRLWGGVDKHGQEGTLPSSARPLAPSQAVRSRGLEASQHMAADCCLSGFLRSQQPCFIYLLFF